MTKYLQNKHITLLVLKMLNTFSGCHKHRLWNRHEFLHVWFCIKENATSTYTRDG